MGAWRGRRQRGKAAADGAAGAGKVQTDAMHIKSVPPLPLTDATQGEALAVMRSAVMALSGVEPENPVWANMLADEEWCCRFLVAREWHVEKAAEMAVESLRWREMRKPVGVLRDAASSEAIALQKECATGKIIAPGRDQHGRSIVVLDNSVQNTTDAAWQLRLLAYKIEFALRQCAPTSDKICLLIKLNNFSLRNNPPWSVTKETIKMLSRCYPETLGLCVIYQAPQIFSILWSIVKPLLDPRTASKVIFVTGDVSDGSSYDAMLRDLITPDWKLICGCEQPVHFPNCTPGFHPSEYWDSVITREREWVQAQAWEESNT